MNPDTGAAHISHVVTLDSSSTFLDIAILMCSTATFKRMCLRDSSLVPKYSGVYLVEVANVCNRISMQASSMQMSIGILCWKQCIVAIQKAATQVLQSLVDTDMLSGCILPLTAFTRYDANRRGCSVIERIRVAKPQHDIMGTCGLRAVSRCWNTQWQTP